MTIDIDKIESVLPQTQCGLCGYGGCRPYAEAMFHRQAPINRCPPGGIAVLQQLSELLAQDPTPFIAEMQQKPFAVAKIREAECIGCTKCIQACPVDAIIGSGKMLHSILRFECTGCELCIAPCPVDCIEMEILPERGYDPVKAKERYYQRQHRLTTKARPQNLRATDEHSRATDERPRGVTKDKKAEILAAVARAKAKRRTGL